MSNRYICIHGHFYQPPRENPWLNKVEIQDSAYPYHDWNHRINAECYRRNTASRILDSQGRIEGIINNYSLISFNIGPTLLAWMKTETPDTYQAILQADRDSQERFSGHGSALAQAYNHMIMPLANERDKETQVIWGIEDFKSRFNRMPEGMWLGETAVDTETLEILARHGIKFTILSPYQAKRSRKIGSKEWQDGTGAKIDSKKPFRCNLPSGNFIDLFFYDGSASQGVAFEGLLNDGKRFANRLQGQFLKSEEPQLVHIATDGESYGHHHKLGEMALSYCLHDIEENDQVKLTIYGEYLEKFPPEHEVEIQENTSWSCAHGVERWRSDCGCNTGGNGDWNQQWRAPLREAFDWVRENLVDLFESQMKEFTADPWELRNKYIEVVLDRGKENVQRFLDEYFENELSQDEKTTVLKLLEMQYHCMLMYTSCGWFFDEVTGIESVQDIFYANRAIQLAGELSGNDYQNEFMEKLGKIESNLPEYNSALDAFEKFVKPMEIDMIRIGAHYAVSSVFEEFPEKVSLYNFTAKVKTKHFYEAGKQKLVIGHTEFWSGITWEKVNIAYAVLHLGNHHLVGGVREYIGAEALEEVHIMASENFKKGNIYEIFNMMDTYFGNHNYSFWHLFKDEQRSIMNLVMENTLKTAEGALQLLYENTYPLLQTFHGLDMEVPNRLRLPVDLAINNQLTEVLKEENFKLNNFRKLISSAEIIYANLNVVTLNFLSDEKLTDLMLKLKEDPVNTDLLKEINAFLLLLDSSPIQPLEWEAQNIAFELMENKYNEISAAQNENTPDNGEWVSEFEQLAGNLNLVIQ